MKDWDYSYLADMVLSPEFLSAAARAEVAIVLTRMSKEIERLQGLVYLKPSQITTFGDYLMFRTDDEDNQNGHPCTILQGKGNNFFLHVGGVDNQIYCQNILTLDEEVRFQKVP